MRRIIAPVAANSSDVLVLDTYAKALLLLGKEEMAQPVVARLRAEGWHETEFGRLSERVR